MVCVCVTHKLKCLGVTLTHQNSMHRKIKSRSIQGMPEWVWSKPSPLLSKNTDSKIHWIIILPIVLYVCVCEMWNFILRKHT
jgi:hypothetical protein